MEPWSGFVARGPLPTASGCCTTTWGPGCQIRENATVGDGCSIRAAAVGRFALRAEEPTNQQRSLIAMWVREATNAELLMRSALGKPAQSLHRRMMVDPEQAGDPGDRDASLAELKSLRCHRLIDRRHNRVAKLNNQRWGGRGSRPLRSRPPTIFPVTRREQGSCWPRDHARRDGREPPNVERPPKRSRFGSVRADTKKWFNRSDPALGRQPKRDRVPGTRQGCRAALPPQQRGPAGTPRGVEDGLEAVSGAARCQKH